MTINSKQLTPLILMMISLSSAFLACSIWLMGSHHHINIISDFYGVSNYISAASLNNIAASAFIVTAILVLSALNSPQHRRLLGSWLIIISAVPLLGLFSPNMWIESLGGFPAIGSGQGVIKYGALLSIGIIWAQPQLSLLVKRWLSVLPVVLVLVWIGGMKFTLFEAKGIEDLVRSSPLMAWMYSFGDLQMVSNIIGSYDLIAAVLLIAAMFKPTLLRPAIMMAGAVFVVTQSFFITWDGAFSPTTILTTGGHFLIKDLWFIINLLMLWQLNKPDHSIS